MSPIVALQMMEKAGIFFSTTSVKLSTSSKKKLVITMELQRKSVRSAETTSTCIPRQVFPHKSPAAGRSALPCGPSIIDNQDIAHVGKMLTELVSHFLHQNSTVF